MIAVVRIAGQQYKVEQDQTLHVPHLEGKAGDKLDLEVLLDDAAGKLAVGSAIKTKVKAEIVTQEITDDKTEKKTQDIKVATETKPVPAEAISSKLTLVANDFGIGSFGGIRNLEMTLRNDSKYLLDKVTAELQYLNPEGVILKTENIYFQSVPAGEAETVAVNKTKRGVKIVYKVTKIESKEVINGTAGL